MPQQKLMSGSRNYQLYREEVGRLVQSIGSQAARGRTVDKDEDDDDDTAASIGIAVCCSLLVDYCYRWPYA